MAIPDEAVEAAARAIYECQPLHGFPSGEVIAWDELTAGAFAKRGLMIEQARAALEAAAPHLKMEAWDEGMWAMYNTTSSEWPPIPEASPYRKGEGDEG